ncbi:hypothetical protein SAMN06269185_2392 [Natronoarchaeum philippinense]|uniref:Uncharacterized protein n=1 Tax=Natronoarchaeum philippinense TaxID=558529 RepID=A0A285P086_NATPI|nr:hypothetical protein [Natronoarchaeum philippinense]SNZ15140.1 hypothetical protein SAMN06269185_2392 [Natronoarchaeum philippinense]
MGAYIGAVGFVVLFGLVWILLRYEFEMPRLVALTFGALVVGVGVIGAAVGQLAGIGSLSGLSGVAVGVTVTLPMLLALVS